MAYIGRDTDKISNVEVLDNITFDGSSSYTLQKNSVNFTPSSANTLLLSIDGVVQAGNFTVSGSTIDFGVAIAGTSTCDFILHYGVGLITAPSDGTVTTAKLADSSVSLAKLTATGTKDSTTFLRGDNTFASAGSPSITDNGNATAISIDSSEVVRFPVGILRLQNATTGSADTDGLLIEASGNDVYINNKESAGMYFRTNNTNRMLIDSSGNLLVGKTSLTLGNTGCQFEGSGGAAFTRSAEEPLYIIRMTNDGKLVSLRQDNTEEGSITVSGSTVSYNGFTGTHWSRFTDNSTPTILRGTVLESLDEMCDWYNLEFDVTTQDEDGNNVTTTEKVPHVLADGQSEGDIITYNYNGTDYQATIVKEADIKHMKSKVSNTVDAKNVYGVFVAYDLDGEGYNDFYVASVGSFVVRIKQGETVAKGDLLQSNGDGTAKVQTDDNVKSSSFAKVLSTTVIETYDDGSFIVPCSLMC